MPRPPREQLAGGHRGFVEEEAGEGVRSDQCGLQRRYGARGVSDEQHRGVEELPYGDDVGRVEGHRMGQHDVRPGGVDPPVDPDDAEVVGQAARDGGPCRGVAAARVDHQQGGPGALVQGGDGVTVTGYCEKFSHGASLPRPSDTAPTSPAAPDTAPTERR